MAHIFLLLCVPCFVSEHLWPGGDGQCNKSKLYWLLALLMMPVETITSAPTVLCFIIKHVQILVLLVKLCDQEGMGKDEEEALPGAFYCTKMCEKPKSNIFLYYENLWAGGDGQGWGGDGLDLESWKVCLLIFSTNLLFMRYCLSSVEFVKIFPKRNFSLKGISPINRLAQ